LENYTFYPTNADGISTTFAVEYCDNDSEALIEAALLLEQHESAVKVVIWQGVRRVFTCIRANAIH
jgi:hypothetical protein